MNLESASQRDPNLPATQSLTPRERDVFRLLALGRTSREIARELYLTHNTAREYVQRIYQKLSVQRRSELISRGVELGYLQVEFYM